MRKLTYMLPAAFAVALAVLHPAGAGAPDPLIERGRYLAAFGACNDCHTLCWP
jgi:hypothetical protein